MAFKLPVLSSLKDSLRRHTGNLPEFQWSELSDKDEIGRGTYGSVFVASYGAAKVVVKKLISSSRTDEKQKFFKEARLLRKLDHRNVVQFKKVCIAPPAIMLDYVYFDFSPFCPDAPRVNCLEEFLSHLDATDDVAQFPLQLKIADDIAKGLEHLHQSDVYHRDLKSSNVLVSNKHYCHMEDQADLIKAFNSEPIICKLTDFGESRSEEIQTQSVVNTRTDNVDRGTPSFMAPEIKVLPAAGAGDLRRIDVWAYGMVIYCIVNPDAKFPFHVDVREALAGWKGPERLDVLKFVEGKLTKQEKPRHSSKYRQLQESQEWKTLIKVYEGCTSFCPAERLTMSQVVDMLAISNQHCKVIPLAVSQNSALEDFDKRFAAGLTPEWSIDLIQDNAINSCAFICVSVGHLLMTNDEIRSLEESAAHSRVVELSEHSIKADHPRIFNKYRNSAQMYDAQEAYAILQKAGVINSAYDLTEEITSSHGVYSANGKKELSEAILKLQSASNVAVAIYTCGQYVLLIGSVREKLFVVDSHPVVENARGQRTGVAIFYDGHADQCSFLCDWLSQRLKQSGVAEGSLQSFAIMTAQRNVKRRHCESEEKKSEEKKSEEKNSEENIATNAAKHVETSVIDLTTEHDADDLPEGHLSSCTNLLCSSGNESDESCLLQDPFSARVNEREGTVENATTTNGESVKLYKGNKNTPLFSSKKDVMKPKEVVSKLLDKEMLSSNVCTIQPLQVNHHATFIVDLQALRSTEDIKCDDVGNWRNNSNDKFFFNLDWMEDYSACVTAVESGGADVATLKREYYMLKHDKDFRKRIDSLFLPGGQLHRYCMVQYSFKSGEEHPIPPMPHGNAKKKRTAYVRTWASTRDQLQNLTGAMKPREALNCAIAEGLGGLQSCSALGQVPRNRQQVADMARRKVFSTGPRPKNMSGARGTSDPWYMLLNESKFQGRYPNTAFIRDVRVGAEPFCVLGTNRQLNDLKRFCCSPVEYRPLTVDPTFDLGPYNVTPISYQHLLLTRRKDGNHPTMIGPVLLHEKKTQTTYALFGGTLKSLEPGLKDLMAFGTDDEKALSGGFNESFERATHLLCEIHLRKNVEGKLISMDIKGVIKQNIVEDIFGKTAGNVFESGLSDAESPAEFTGMLESLEDKWTAAHTNGKLFHSWFVRMKSDDFIRSVIRPVRHRAGLGCPPERFTTNRSERTNGVLQDFIKRDCGSAKVDEYTFAKSLEKLVKIQEQEIEMAVLDKGEYQLRTEFCHLIISGTEWIKMTSAQKKAALLRIHQISLDEVSPNNVTAANAMLVEDKSAVFQQIVSAGVDWITLDVLQLVSNKAEELFDQGKVTQIPAAAAHDMLVVPSKSKPAKPHIIIVYANGKVECQDCPGYAACSICAHAVAASLMKGSLDVYLKWLVANKRKSGGINYSNAITFGMPAGRGRKGARAPRKRQGKQSSATIVVPRIVAPPTMGQSTSVPFNFHPNVHGLVSPIPVNSHNVPQVVSSPFPEWRSPMSEVPLHQQQPSIHQCANPPMASAAAWHAGMSPHVYYLIPLPNNVRKCYGCGANFVDKFRQPPYNIIVKHVDRRLVRREPATGALVYSPDFSNTYYHPSFEHIQRKNPTFNGLVHIDSAVHRALDLIQIQVLQACDLNICIRN